MFETEEPPPPVLVRSQVFPSETTIEELEKWADGFCPRKGRFIQVQVQLFDKTMADVSIKTRSTH